MSNHPLNNAFKIWNIEELLKKQQATDKKSSVFHIPTDPQLFYESFGLLANPNSKLPSKSLTGYQREIWKHPAKYKLVVKSQKVGLSTSELLHDFQLAITVCKGQDILVIAQTLQHAIEHLNTLKFLIINSDKYSHFLITKPSEMLFKEMRTKVGVAFIKNPDNPKKPTRIIALGSSEGAVWSWKNVAHIHMSDIAASKSVDDSGLFAAAFSRLANTNGTLIIETPPRGPKGMIYQIYRKSLEQTDLDNPESQFKIFHVYAREAVAAGLMTQEFLDGEKQRLGALYPQYYEAEFIASINTVFDLDAIERATVAGLQEGINYNPEYHSITSLGVDPGFGSSPTAFTVLQSWNQKARVLYTETMNRPSYVDIVDTALSLMREYRITKVYVDSSGSGFIETMKRALGENDDYLSELKKAKSEGVAPEHYMQIIPVFFNQETKKMLQQTKYTLEKGNLVIHPQFKNLLEEMRTAIEKDGKLVKTPGHQFDLLESLMLALQLWSYQ